MPQFCSYVPTCSFPEGRCFLLYQAEKQSLTGGTTSLDSLDPGPIWPRSTWTTFINRTIEISKLHGCANCVNIETQLANITRRKETNNELIAG